MKRLILILADITTIAVDAMVNPANKSLLAGSGLCGVMHKKAGRDVTSQCKQIYLQHGAQPVGGAIVTQAGRLPARCLIHAVGPRWIDGNHGEVQLLADTYSSILRQAETNKAKTLSIPAISTGVHAFPKQLAADIAIDTLSKQLPTCNYIETAFLACFDENTARLYETGIKRTEIHYEGIVVVDLLPSLED